MNIRAILASSLVLIVLVSFAPLPSLAQPNTAFARVIVCNKGQININIVIGTQTGLLFSHDINVNAWTAVEPGACRQVYHGSNDASTGARLERSYIGVGFYDPQGQLIAGHASGLPTLGAHSAAAPIITAAEDRFCVRSTAFSYRIPEHAELNCGTFRVGANDPGGYTSFPAALAIEPQPGFCTDQPYICHSGDYYLNVTATRISAEIGITVRDGDHQQADVSPGAGETDAGTQFLQQLAKAAVEQGKKLADERAAAAAQSKQLQADYTRQQWAGSRESPAAFDPRWLGQKVVIVGTVSRVDVERNGSPRWVTIYFKESPDASFVVCSPYPDLLQERVGPNLGSLVGKTLQAAGQVESPYCGGKAPKGSIRVLESTQWQVQ